MGIQFVHADREGDVWRTAVFRFASLTDQPRPAFVIVYRGRELVAEHWPGSNEAEPDVRSARVPAGIGYVAIAGRCGLGFARLPLAASGDAEMTVGAFALGATVRFLVSGVNGSRMGAVAVRLAYSDGVPAPIEMLPLEGEVKWTADEIQVLTDAAGSLTLHNLPPGDYVATIGGEDAAVRFQCGSGDSLTFERWIEER